MSKQRVNILRNASVVAALVLMMATVSAQSKQEHVHDMANGVMPFDVSKSTHIFKMTESGGVQKVIAKDIAAHDQIALIQQHLKHEAEQFQQGRYMDPAKLHGAEMPGLKDLQAGASRVKVTYSALPDGAQILFETKDVQMLTAVHRWFGAQLSEHGADAKPE